MPLDLVPAARTAQRLDWRFLPAHVRALIEERIGSPVTGAVSQNSGYTPGFASVLTCADGSRHFVKAASIQAQRLFAASYREEARKLALLPDTVAAPRLLWSHDDDWVVLETEYVDARAPRRPWRHAELDRVLDTVEQTTRTLTPAPAELALDSFATEFAALAQAWESLGDLPHAAEAAELAARCAEVAAGDSVVHTDIRDDNLLLTTDGSVWICDWNWPVTGAAWLDSLFVLLQPVGDGLDGDALVAGRPLLRDVPADDLDSVLAGLSGHFHRSAREPVPPTSPYLRQHQAWMAEAAWSWLARRRGWC